MKLKIFNFVCAIVETLLVGMIWGGYIADPDINTLVPSIYLTIMTLISVVLLGFDYIIDLEVKDE